jgi:hypothetical protein
MSDRRFCIWCSDFKEEGTLLPMVIEIHGWKKSVQANVCWDCLHELSKDEGGGDWYAATRR